MLTSTAPVLPVTTVSIHDPRPTGPGTQCPTTQSWFAFHTAVSAHVPSHLGSSRSVFVHTGVDPCAPRAHLAVMVTPRTHCQFTTQARAPRVPELCDDHTPPSCLVTNSLAEPRYRSVNTPVLPDPLLTQGDQVTFLAFALHVRLGASFSVLFTYLCLYTPQLIAAFAFLCLSSLSLRAHMDELQNRRLLLGTTGWNHSYYTGVPLSALHSLQQVTSWCELPVPCAETGLHTGVTWCSDFKLCVLPTGYTQCHQSTGSDAVHPHCHK